MERKDLANIVSEVRNELINVVDTLNLYNAGETAKVHAMSDGNIRVVFGCDWFGYIRFDGVGFHAKQMRGGEANREFFDNVRDAVVWLVKNYFALQIPRYIELGANVSIDEVKRALCAKGFRLVPINRESDALKCAPQWRIEEFV